MTDVIPAVDGTVETPSEELNQGQSAPIDQELAELQTKYETLEAEKTRLEAERDNYRKGMLKAKGKLEDDEPIMPSEDEDERIRRIIREENMRSDLARVNAEQKKSVEQLLKKNQELATALKNRSNITPSGGSGTSGNEPTPKDNILSADQLNALKARGWDDKKIEQYKKNLLPK